VFAAAVEAGFTNLAILAVLASVASAYYYLRVVVTMYMVPKEEGADLESTPPASGVVLAISAALVLIFGVLPGLLLSRLG
jgi:NADH-quinone oxidoreductase subunit N